MLDNISVTQSTLESIHPRVADLLYNNQVNFNDVISRAKKKVYSDIKDDYMKDYSYLTNTQADSDLAKVKDLPTEQYLQERIAKLAIAEIYLINEDLERYQIWKQEAYDVPLKYYIDTDSSDSAGYGEIKKPVTFPGFSR